MSEATSVYQYYDGDGALVYVGITKRGNRRLHEHADSKPWWPEVTGCSIEHHPSREAALARESYLIATYRPRYNVAGLDRVNVPFVPPPDGRDPRRAPALRCCGSCGVRPASKGRHDCPTCRIDASKSMQQQARTTAAAREAELMAIEHRLLPDLCAFLPGWPADYSPATHVIVAKNWAANMVGPVCTWSSEVPGTTGPVDLDRQLLDLLDDGWSVELHARA